jgi:hypothetical protein
MPDARPLGSECPNQGGDVAEATARGSLVLARLPSSALASRSLESNGPSCAEWVDVSRGCQADRPTPVNGRHAFAIRDGGEDIVRGNVLTPPQTDYFLPLNRVVKFLSMLPEDLRTPFRVHAHEGRRGLDAGARTISVHIIAAKVLVHDLENSRSFICSRMCAYVACRPSDTTSRTYEH